MFHTTLLILVASAIAVGAAPRVPAETATVEAGWGWPHWLGLGLGGALVLALMVAFARYLRLCLRMFLDMSMPMTAGIGNGDRVAGEVHSFPSRDGTSLRGVFIEPPPGAAVRGNIVFAHEFGGNRNNAARYAAGLPDAGFRVFTFDFRAHGESSNAEPYEPKHWVTEYEVNDLLAAVAYVEATVGHAGGESLPIGILGVSRGGCAAAIAALHTPKIRALCLDGLFSTDMLMESLMKRWAAIFATINLVRPNHPPEIFGILRVFTVLYAELKLRCRYPLVRKVLGRLADTPLLMIYGQDDTYLDSEHRIKLYRAKRGPKHLWEVPGAKHNQAVTADPEGYRREVVAFFERTLAPGPIAVAPLKPKEDAA